LPFFFYNNIGLTYLQTEVTGSIVSQMYPYDWLPLYTIATLMIFEILTFNENTKQAFSQTAKKEHTQ
jgi:hypothetical protein